VPIRTERNSGELQLTVSGTTLPDLFVELARFIADAAGHPRGDYGPWERVTLSAPDSATLFADWANELIGRAEVDQRGYDDVRVRRLDDGHIDAELRGRPVRNWRSSIKAATYHGLRLERVSDGWRASLLLDV
jgi:protein archease